MPHMSRLAGYRTLCATVGVTWVVGGLALLGAFVGYHAPDSEASFPTGPVGHYFAAFAGCALVGWGGGLLGAARRPAAGRAVGTATAVALVLAALMRILAWLIGDYHAWLGDVARVEAAVFLVLALAFVWLRPATAVPAS